MIKRYADYTKDDLMRLLESLTPGGSEFYESPENCARFIRERKGKPRAAHLTRGKERAVTDKEKIDAAIE